MDKRRYLLVLTVILVSASGLPASTSAAEYFQQSVEYEIRAGLNPSDHTISGRQTIRYTNNSPDTLSEFYLFLYPNAFRSRESELLKHYARRFNHVVFDLPRKYRSYLEIRDVTVGSAPVTVKVDDTVAQFALPAPLLPGGSIDIKLEFEGRIGRLIGRAGYSGEHYDMAQWYPKAAVYDENGFHPDKFKDGEFYGEFATYDVFLELPERYVVAATGTVVSGDPGWDFNTAGDGGEQPRPRPGGAETKTVHFHAERVHDFAWCADPDFVVQDTSVGDVKVMSFYRMKNARAWKDSALVYGVRAVEWLTEKIGPFPYPQVSIVDALISGGMEYPMLVMNGSAGEAITLHEVGHMYFYGALGNNEREEAWLDEGFATFQTAWYLQERYGPWGDRGKWNLYQKITPQYTIAGNARRELRWLQHRRYGERIAKRAEDFDNSYRFHVYEKAALMLNSLRYVVGPETFEAILREYYERWRFKHVNEERFVEVCESVSGMDLDLFFEQWLHTRKICDYKLEEVKTKPAPEGYDVAVKVKREGEMILPVELVFDMENGEHKSFRVDGKLRTTQQTFTLPSKPKRAAINPDNEIVDIKLSDNFSPRRRSLQFDWPNNFYYPEDAYQIRYRPGAWYNDVDGYKVGLHFKGSYLNRFRKIELGLYYGVDSDRLDFSACYDRPGRFFGNNAKVRLSGYKMEGRIDATALLLVQRRKTLIVPPTQEFTLGFNYHELTNASYLADPETYDTSMTDLGPFFGYSVDPEFDVFSSRVDVGLKLGREWFDGKFKYERLTTTIGLYSRPVMVPADVKVRVFLGLLGGNAPRQQKFNLAGGGPLATEKRFYLRSPGAIWEDLNYHEPGDGNLRGYHAGTFGVNRLLALNLETGTKLPLLWLDGIIGKTVGRLSWAAFLDVGKIFDKDNPIGNSARVQSLVDGGVLDQTLFDAGVGLRSRRLFPFYDMSLRLDLPLYVNHPEINGEKDETKMRYLLSLRGTF